MDTRAVILHYLEYTDEMYCELVEDTGLNWLRERFSHSVELYDRWRRSKHFWSWWTMQWDMRDSDLVQGLGIEADDRLDADYIDAFCKTFSEKHCLAQMKLYPAKPIIKKINTDESNNKNQ